MNKLFKSFKANSLFILLIAIYIFAYRAWFLSGIIFGGDFPFFYDNFSLIDFPYAWSILGSFGLGGYGVPLLWSYAPVAIPVLLLEKVNITWQLIERIGILFPYLAISIISSWYGFGRIFKEQEIKLIASVVFLLNTFILMLIGGGLVSTALALALLPTIFAVFLNKTKTRSGLLIGMFMGLQVTLDLRIAFLTVCILSIYFLIHILSDKTNVTSKLIKAFILPGIIAFMLNTYWIIPTLIIRRNPLDLVGETYTGIKILEFLSFTKFENAFSLLSPIWPENIFGKVGFLKPEFLLLPLFAFSALAFLKNEKRGMRILVIFTGIISLIGIFMAKGVNPPLGEVYSFFYKYIPGFQMFRDSSKWFVLILFGYSILIPYTVSKIIEFNKPIRKLIIVLLAFYFIFLLRPAFNGNLTKLFITTPIPSDYYYFKKFVESQNQYFRTGWYPNYSRLIFGPANNIAVPLSEFLATYDPNKLKTELENSKTLIEHSSIKYIGVTNDFKHEIFLTDRKYDEKKYEDALKDLETITWLKKARTFGKIVIFEVPSYKDHFWSPNPGLKISYKYINPTKYLVSLQNARQADLLIFSESYDSKWIIRNEEFEISSSKFNDKFNSYKLPRSGNYAFEVYYTPQDWVDMGVIVSFLSLLSILSLLLFGYKYKKW